VNLRRRFLISAAVLALVLAACGSEAPEEATSERSPAAPSATSAPATSDSSSPGGAPSELLMFTAPAIGGGQVDAAVFQGRPTLLWFWAPW